MATDIRRKLTIDKMNNVANLTQLFNNIAGEDEDIESLMLNKRAERKRSMSENARSSTTSINTSMINTLVTTATISKAAIAIVEVEQIPEEMVAVEKTVAVQEIVAVPETATIEETVAVEETEPVTVPAEDVSEEDVSEEVSEADIINHVSVVPLNVGLEESQRKIGVDEQMTNQLIERVEEAMKGLEK